jgi:DNA-binding beta-propeller fold protein YncE
VGEYTTSGATINASLIMGLSSPRGVAVSGSDLFVTNSFTGTIGEYTTSGSTVNASLITGLHGPVGIAVSGSNLFVANDSGGTIDEYTTSGGTVNASLITGLSGPIGLALVPEPSTALRLSAGFLAVAVRYRSAQKVGQHASRREAGLSEIVEALNPS